MGNGKIAMQHDDVPDAQVFDTPEAISAVVLLSLKGRLRLEAKGMKCKGPSALKICKQNWPEVKNAQMALDKIANLLHRNPSSGA
jgi:hypothetical protein